MAKKGEVPDKYQIWIDARKRFHLSQAHIQMARELGMNPKKFGKLASHKQEPWKAPLPVFIERIYFKRFEKKRPDELKSIEQLAEEYEKKKHVLSLCLKTHHGICLRLITPCSKCIVMNLIVIVGEFFSMLYLH